MLIRRGVAGAAGARRFGLPVGLAGGRLLDGRLSVASPSSLERSCQPSAELPCDELPCDELFGDELFDAMPARRRGRKLVVFFRLCEGGRDGETERKGSASGQNQSAHLTPLDVHESVPIR